MRTKLMSAAALAIAASMGAANTAAVAQDCPSTTPEENVSIVEQYIQEVTAGDVAAAEEVVDDDFEHNLSRAGVDYGDPSPSTLVEQTPSNVSVHDIFGSGDNVAVRFSFPVSSDAVEGAPADETAEVNAIAIARIECGEIQQVWMEYDDFGLALAMGMELETAE